MQQRVHWGELKRKLWSMRLGQVQGNSGIGAVLDVRRVPGGAVSGGMRGELRRKLWSMRLGQVQGNSGIRAVLNVLWLSSWSGSKWVRRRVRGNVCLDISRCVRAFGTS